VPFLRQGEVAVEILRDHRLELDEDGALGVRLGHRDLRSGSTYGFVTYAAVTGDRDPW
jgi:hypothetical protein